VFTRQATNATRICRGTEHVRGLHQATQWALQQQRVLKVYIMLIVKANHMS